MAARLLRWFDVITAVGVAIGFIVQFTVRDTWPVTALIFYATPMPVLATGAAWLAWRLRRNRRRQVSQLFGMLFALLWWIAHDWKMPAPSTKQADLRVVHWNVARPEARWPQVAGQLHAYDADVIAVAEAMPKKNSTMERWQAEFPGYVTAFSAGEMLCLVRGEVQHRESGWLGPSSFYSALDVVVKNHPATILQVDLIATPWRSRREPLQELMKVVDARRDRPLIVLGDFNTPRGSVLFNPLRAQLTHAWEKAGSGCAETWPLPVPILSLDHVWLGHLHALRCMHGVSAWSDHRPVIVDLAWQ